MLKAGEYCYKTRIFQHVYTSRLEGEHHTVNAYKIQYIGRIKQDRIDYIECDTNTVIIN